jgi:hypothetical protein
VGGVGNAAAVAVSPLHLSVLAIKSTTFVDRVVVVVVTRVVVVDVAFSLCNKRDIIDAVRCFSHRSDDHLEKV